MNLLYERDEYVRLMKEMTARFESVKRAVLASGSHQLIDMFPEYVPPATVKQMNQALDKNDPIEVQTTMTAEEAMDFLGTMTVLSGTMDDSDFEDDLTGM